MYKENQNILNQIEIAVKVAKSKWQTKDGKWWTNDGTGKKPYNPTAGSSNKPTTADSPTANSPDKPAKMSKKDRELHEELTSNIEEIKSGNMDANDIINTMDDLAEGIGMSKKKVRNKVQEMLTQHGIDFDKRYFD